MFFRQMRRDHGHRDDDRRFARGPRHAHADTGFDALDQSPPRGERHGPRGRHRGGPGGGSRGGRGGGREGGRLFDHGELRFVLLALLAEKPRHGYEIIKAIEDRAGGSYSPSPGVIYPTLTLMEELGHASVTEDGGKKSYALTDAGRAFLQANQRIAEAALARIAEAAAARGPGLAPQIVRATENLKVALRLRLSGGALSDPQIRVIAAALDAAAAAIEEA